MNTLKHTCTFEKMLDTFNENQGFLRESFTKHSFLPEGEDWNVKLQDGCIIRVHRCSYEVENADVVYVWIDMKVNVGLVATIKYKDSISRDVVLLENEQMTKV